MNIVLTTGDLAATLGLHVADALAGPTDLGTLIVLAPAWGVMFAVAGVDRPSRLRAAWSGIGIATSCLLPPVTAVLAAAFGGMLALYRLRRRGVSATEVLVAAVTVGAGSGAAHYILGAPEVVARTSETPWAGGLLMVAAIAIALQATISETKRGLRVNRLQLLDLVQAAGVQGSIGLAIMIQQPVFGHLGTVVLVMLMLVSAHVFALRWAIQTAQSETVGALSSFVDLQAGSMPGHAPRVCKLAASLGRAAGLNSAEVEKLSGAALVHGIGALASQEGTDQPCCAQVASETVRVLTGAKYLSRFAPIVSAAASLSRGYSLADEPERLAGEVLHLACAADQIAATTGASVADAVREVISAATFECSPRMASALRLWNLADRAQK